MITCIRPALVGNERVRRLNEIAHQPRVEFLYRVIFFDTFILFSWLSLPASFHFYLYNLIGSGVALDAIKNNVARTLDSPLNEKSQCWANRRVTGGICRIIQLSDRHLAIGCDIAYPRARKSDILRQ
jgi:hypothetical protein